MAQPTLTEVPALITAGDTVLLSLNVPDYPPADGWSLSFSFASKGKSAIVWTSTQDGGNHAITVAAATSSEYQPAVYRGNGWATKDNGTTRVLVWDGFLEVRPNLDGQSQDFDPRSHAEKMLESINSVLEGKATKDALSTTIAGQSILRMTYDQLIGARNYYQAIVDQERAALGAPKSNNILLRFT